MKALTTVPGRRSHHHMPNIVCTLEYVRSIRIALAFRPQRVRGHCARRSFLSRKSSHKARLTSKSAAGHFLVASLTHLLAYNHAAMNRARQIVWLRLLFVFYIGLILGGLSLHFWTVKMVLYVQGRGYAMVALVIPVGAEIYWAIKVWRSLGFANLYTLAVIGYGVLWPLMAWVLTTLEKTDKKQAPNNFGDASELVAEILLRPHPCGHGCPCLQLRKVERIDEAIRKLHLQKLQSKPRNT
jgi:hypothetical protein